MTLHDKLGLIGCAGQLALSFLLILRRQRSALLFPLALLCIDVFAWNFADLAWELTGTRTWRTLDTAVSWLTPPLGLQFVLAFVGRTRSMRPLLVVAYVFFAQLPFWADTPGWDLVFLAGVVPLVAICLGLLVIHLVRTTDPNEASATRYILAALKGALQFLKEEQKQGRSLAAHQEFLDLMLDQVERLHRIVDEYQRMGRVEPVCTPGNINDVVRDVLAIQPASVTDGMQVVTELEDALPTCHFDRDLITRAFENLVQNAFEAMPQGGTLAVRTERAPHTADTIAVSVTDSGTGMDVRQAEHAFDDFYTTKAQGSGLGLSFVRRVAEAHGGHVALKSDLGKGTTIRIELPVEHRG